LLSVFILVHELLWSTTAESCRNEYSRRDNVQSLKLYAASVAITLPDVALDVSNIGKKDFA
jgi:hypothetical protein